ncbi:MAG: hypothetical protein J0L93_05095 [Deltaproteobacteria bacterium]|nr:hypothetical protein [Deltaproteobacteria bacterium]
MSTAERYVNDMRSNATALLDTLSFFNRPSFAVAQSSAVSIPAIFPKPEIIQDNAEINCSFNVMNGRSVSEKFLVKEYRIWDRYGEATLDREYFSSMEKSPDHLIFLTGLIHSQKLLYLLLSKEFGFEYSPEKKEDLKIWPTSIKIEMPKMVRKNQDVVQKMWINSVKPKGNNQYEVNMTSEYEGVIKIESVSSIFFVNK